MNLRLPFKLKVDNIIKNGSSFEGKIVFHDKEYHVNINTQKNEKTLRVPFSVIGISQNEILVRLSSTSGVYVQDHIKFKGTSENLEIDSDIIFHEIANNEIKFDTIEIFVK